MRFIRSMPWLRNCFPPTELPREGPSLISDNVQYTSDYWGGGYANREPEAWYSVGLVTKAADRTPYLLDAMPVDQTVRIIAVGVEKLVPANFVVDLRCGLLSVSPSTAVAVPITNPQTQVVGAGALAGTIGWLALPHPTLVPGSSSLYVWFYTGDNTDYRFYFLSVAVPRGVMLIA